MFDIRLGKVTKRFGRPRRRRPGESDCRPGRGGVSAWSVRVRQDHDVAHDRRARMGDVGRDHDRRQSASTTCRRATRNVAMTFQFYALYPSLSVEENLAYPLHAEKLSKARDRRAGRPRQRGARPQGDSQAPPPSARRGREAARRGRALDRPRAHLLSVRRALEPPRHSVAPDDAHSDQGNSDQARQADGDRDPRPDRGVDDGRPHRGHAARARSSRSPRRTSCFRGRPICLSRASSERRR